MKDTVSALKITVLGTFQMRTQDGACLTPRGAKNQALVALLALSPEMTRPRRWLEDKLWSTFGPEQASANLRQALSKIRTSLGDQADILNADRNSVSLASRHVIVDLHEDVLPRDLRMDLLQGMDVRDPEFEEWLRMERAELQSNIARATPSEAKGILINCRSTSEHVDQAHMLGEILSNQIGEGIGEQVRTWRQSYDATDPASQAPQSDISVTTQIMKSDKGHSVFLKAQHQPSARILYSKLMHLDRLEDILETEEKVGKVVFEASDQIIGKLPLVLDNNRPEARATALSRLGLYRMFSFESDALREAYGLMNQAFEHDENGIYVAWSSLIRLTQMMEMPEADQAALMEEAVEMHYRAIELGGDNGLVHAIVSKVRGTALGDPAGVRDHAQNAVERNPASAFAWKALAEAYMLEGKTEKALETSALACRLARSSPFKHWWDTGHCVIAISCNRPDLAIEAGEAAARAAPLSRPALRHMLALYAMDGQLEKAQNVATKLAKIEPGFSLDRLINDESYPVRTLRNKGLLEPIRALL